MTTKAKKKAWVQDCIEHCRGLADGLIEAVEQDCGLCWELRALSSLRCVDLDACFAEWGKFSGDNLYPIKCPSESRYTPETIYGLEDDKWGDHPYGDLRRELCEHVAGWLEENIEELIV